MNMDVQSYFSWIFSTLCTIGISLPSILKTTISPTLMGSSTRLVRNSRSPLWKAGSILPLKLNRHWRNKLVDSNWSYKYATFLLCLEEMTSNAFMILLFYSSLLVRPSWFCLQTYVYKMVMSVMRPPPQGEAKQSCTQAILQGCWL